MPERRIARSSGAFRSHLDLKIPTDLIGLTLVRKKSTVEVVRDLKIRILELGPTIVRLRIALPMPLKDELTQEIGKILREQWEMRDGNVVPDPDVLKLGNDGVNLDATVLYADMDGSTAIVEKYKSSFAAEVYKAYLNAAAKVIRAEGGQITAYDGDRIMAVFLGEEKNTSAARTSLKINYCVNKIINPLIKEQYPSTQFELRQTVGIDTSKLLAARIGVRGANDLVWVGRAANYAAKLTTLGAEFPSRITKAVHDSLHESAKVTNGKAMWEERQWTSMNNLAIYRSNWWWEI